MVYIPIKFIEIKKKKTSQIVAARDQNRRLNKTS